jgi:hypothetical protein
VIRRKATLGTFCHSSVEDLTGIDVDLFAEKFRSASLSFCALLLGSRISDCSVTSPSGRRCTVERN